MQVPPPPSSFEQIAGVVHVFVTGQMDSPEGQLGTHSPMTPALGFHCWPVGQVHVSLLPTICVGAQQMGAWLDVPVLHS